VRRIGFLASPYQQQSRSCREERVTILNMIDNRSTWGKRSIALFAPIALIAAGIVSIVSPVSAQESTPATTTPIGVVETDATEINCSTDPATPSPLTTSVTTTYVIGPDGSEARYRVQEELVNKGAIEAVGSTTAIQGGIYLDEAGIPLACSRFDVDLRTLTSDESRRDNALHSQTLETATYPLATFVLSSIEGIDSALVEGEDTTVVLVGNLTMHDVTRVVAWEATVTLNGDVITGKAATEFEMPEFNITPPKMGPVLSIDETVVLEIDFTANKA